MRHALKKAALAAKLPEDVVRWISNHDFRHSRTTCLLDRGASLTGVAYLVGHQQVTTTNRDAYASRDAAEEALELDAGHRIGHGAPKPAPD